MEELETKEDKNDENKKVGFTIHRLTNGKQFCFLPINGDFEFIRMSS